ncbi:MAG: metallopeptidase TldD-related protein [Acidobacteria bacterium]|nr:metallopeptidase TldD-related protein [Acidobacteriota bacterium]
MMFRFFCAARLSCVALMLSLAAWGAPQKPAPQQQARAKPAEASVLVDALQKELARAMTELGKSDPAPYFISYSAAEHHTEVISSTQGALFPPVDRNVRSVDVTVRVGSHTLDNTHSDRRSSGLGSALLPLEDDPAAIGHVLWQLTDRQYKQAARSLLEVKTETQVRAEDEDNSPDFSEEKPQTRVGSPVAHPDFDRNAWRERMQRLSGIFRQYPEVYNSVVFLLVDTSNKYFVSSEGSRVTTSRPLNRLVAYAETRADDGMELLRSETFDASTVDGLPDEKEIAARIHKMAADLVKLRKAPIVEPFIGPALLSGRASAVFFHEVLGHRLEGQRQRGDEEGQTFAKKVDQKILPEFLSVVSDPTLRRLEGIELSGFYEFDDEGIPSRRTEVVQHGVLKGFLMSRLPVRGFAESNGHGRAQEGLMPVGRQANLIVSSTNKVPDSGLRQKLIEEVKRQNKPYGLFFEDIAGGFTLTTRFLPQAFQILPVLVWRVYPDGRPDELVRGVDIVGTPLAALNRLVVTGEKTEVFNGVCGAESGSVPVAAAAPAILFSEIEVQKKAVTRNRPPILSPPGAPTAAPAPPEVKP